MRGDITLPGPVYIETCGVIVCRGDVRRADPATWEMVEVWPAALQPGEREGLRALHYEGRGLHAGETVELCRGVMGRLGSDVSLVYAHRGCRCEWTTPLLQRLLALLEPGVRAHGLQVEQDQLPLDLVLFGVATLARCERCVILKDNAIRVGAEEVMPASTTQYLVLSRESGSWAIEGIALDEKGSACPSSIAAPSLDKFLADGDHGVRSLSLSCWAANGCLGTLKVVRVGENEGVLGPAAGESGLAGRTVATRVPGARRCSANAARVASRGKGGGVGNA